MTLSSPGSSSEAFLLELGVHRFPVPIPFVDAGGPVNVYAVLNEDGSYTLFDTGLGTPEAERALREAAAAEGVDLSRVSRILVSHGHIDHYGLAQKLAQESGATVHVHPADWTKVVGPDESMDLARTELYRVYFRRLGVDAELSAKMFQVRAATQRLAGRVEPARARPLHGGERLRFAHLEAEVLHLPGHTPGLVCLWDATHRLLFADDHVLAKVSPNPQLELGKRGEEDKFPALVSYLESARRVLELDVDWVLPGHGPAFQGHRALLTDLFSFYERRQERLLKRLEKGEATAVELLNAVFLNVEPVRLFLMLSEVVGNLEVLERAGQVRRRRLGEVYLFSRAE